MHIVISAFYLVLLVLVLADIISAGPDRFKNLNKMFWIIIVIIMPVVGSVLWFAVGREYDNRRADLGSFGDPRRRERVEHRAPTIEEELAALDAEIAYNEKQAEIRRLEAKLQQRRTRDASAEG